jgi:DNA replication protein DnaC
MPVGKIPTSPVEDIRRRMVGLKMARALEVLDATIGQLEQGKLSPLEAIDVLLQEELSTRESRRIKMGLMTARLTQIKTLESFDFSFQPSLDRNQVLTLAQLGFIGRKEVVHFLGPPGTGKTHLAVAMGCEAVKAGHSVYFGTLAEVITSLVKAEREGNLVNRIRFMRSKTEHHGFTRG